jgi:hypothetical protein
MVEVSKMRSIRLLLALLSLVCLNGCAGDVASTTDPRSASEIKQQKVTELNRQKADALYEIQLREEEMKQMEAITKKPGVVGVSNQWLERHNQLKEEVIQLKVKVHDLDLQIDSLSKP